MGYSRRFSSAASLFAPVELDLADNRIFVWGVVVGNDTEV